MDVDNLRACYGTLEPHKATGVDGVTKRAYGENLEQNLQDLSQRLKDMKYRPQPTRRSYIPKPGSAKGRPLGISSLEDKLVEASVRQVLEPIYEPVFEDSSYGYRPERCAHHCLDELGRTIQQKYISYVVEADIRSFFDKVNHQWMLKFLEHRIGDPRILRLINRMLKAGIMEDGLVSPARKVPRKDRFCRRCCPTSICTTRWTCGLPGGSRSAAEAKRIIFAMPMIFWPAFSTNPMQRHSENSWRIDCRGLAWSWRWKRHSALNLAGLHVITHGKGGKSPKNSRFWDLPTTAARRERDISSSRGVPVVRNSD